MQHLSGRFSKPTPENEIIEVAQAVSKGKFLKTRHFLYKFRTRIPRELAFAAKIFTFASLGGLFYSTIHLAKDNKDMAEELAKSRGLNLAYEQRFKDMAAAGDMLTSLEKEVAALGQAYGSENFFENTRRAIGGLRRIFKNIPIYGENNDEILRSVQEAMGEIDSDKILQTYSVKAHPVAAYKEKYPGIGVLRIGKLETMAMGQDYSEKSTIFFIPVGGSPHPFYDANNADLEDPDSRNVYTDNYSAIVLEDYMHKTEGRRIFIQLVGVTDENGMPFGMSIGHNADYNVFPRYKSKTVIEKGGRVGILGWTGEMNGIHGHFGFYTAGEVDAKTGIGSNWKRFDPYENKTYGQNFALFPLEHLPQGIKDAIRKYVN